MKQYALTLDLKDNKELIQEYINYHKNVWPQVIDSIKISGIVNMKIYHVANRLFMLIETRDDFSFERKNDIDLSTPKVMEWESLMDNYQKRLPFAKAGEKWVLMSKIIEI